MFRYRSHSVPKFYYLRPLNCAAHSESLTDFGMSFEKLQSYFDDIEKFLLVKDYRQKIFPDGDTIAVKSAERNYKTALALPGISLTTFNALAEINAFGFVESNGLG